jgi:ribonuclease BN (tRNA processing enzyme)
MKPFAAVWGALGALLLVAVPPAAAQPVVELILLGTAGGPIPQVGRSQPANAIVVGDDTYVFDVGNGVLRQLAAAGRPLGSIRTIFITHHHLDHNADLGTILGLRNNQSITRPLTIVGPPGVNRMLAGWLQYAGPTFDAGPQPPSQRRDPLSNVKPVEIAAPGLVYQDEQIRVFAAENAHYHFVAGSGQEAIAKSYAYRVETPGRVIVFTGDTGPSDAVTALAHDADILVSEVQDPADVDRIMRFAFANAPETTRRFVEQHLRNDHLTPEQVGQVAAAARVKAVVLTHIPPPLGGPTDTAALVEGVRRTFSGQVTVGTDLMKM